MKRTIITLLLLLLLLGGLAVGASAEETQSGVCGDNLTWTKEGTVLTISGTGPMYDYSEENPAPWGNMSYVKTCNIEYGVTSIGDYAFRNKAMGSIMYKIAASVEKIGHKVFSDDRVVCYFLGDAPEIAEDAFDSAYGGFGYFTGWDEADLQDYGGDPTWYKGTLMPGNDGKMLYTSDKPYELPEKITVQVTFENNSHNLSTLYYTPKQVQITEDDNSTLGPKSIVVDADGIVVEYKYIITDGQSHFDLVEIEEIPPQEYRGQFIPIKPVVSAGGIILKKGVHYDQVYSADPQAGTKQTVKVRGLGEWEGLVKTAEFLVLKRDISTLSISVKDAQFTGMPVTPDAYVSSATESLELKQGEDYIVVCENNVNMGTATCRVIGIGSCYGVVTKTFNIVAEETTATLEGTYIGQADGELDNEQYYYAEKLIPPGQFTAKINSNDGNYTRRHIAYYELYQIVGEEAQLIKTLETPYGYADTTKFTYDFSGVYEGAAEEGGEVYMLVYTWVNSQNAVFSGVCMLAVPAKVPKATEMGVALVDAGDFRTAQVAAFGLDGDIGEVTWTSSDPSVATVDGGILTPIKPGSVTITAQCGDLSASIMLVGVPDDLSAGEIIRNSAAPEKFSVYYDAHLLVEGTDYIKEVSVKDGVKEVKITGIGGFAGELVQQFDEKDMPVGHTHGYTSTCDTTCSRCDEIRTDADKHIYGDDLVKDSAGHWHECTVCGAKLDYEAHNLSAQDSTVCTVCGKLYMPGDLNGDFQVDNKDVEHLLWHTLFPESYAVNQDVDFDSSGAVDNKDVEHLLWHTLFPESYPL